MPDLLHSKTWIISKQWSCCWEVVRKMFSLWNVSYKPSLKPYLKVHSLQWPIIGSCPALHTASGANHVKVRCGKLSSNHLQLKGKLTAKYQVCFSNNLHHWVQKKDGFCSDLARTRSVQCIDLFIGICTIRQIILICDVCTTPSTYDALQENCPSTKVHCLCYKAVKI